MLESSLDPGDVDDGCSAVSLFTPAKAFRLIVKVPNRCFHKLGLPFGTSAVCGELAGGVLACAVDVLAPELGEATAAGWEAVVTELLALDVLSPVIDGRSGLLVRGRWFCLLNDFIGFGWAGPACASSVASGLGCERRCFPSLNRTELFGSTFEPLFALAGESAGAADWPSGPPVETGGDADDWLAAAAAAAASAALFKARSGSGFRPPNKESLSGDRGAVAFRRTSIARGWRGLLSLWPTGSSAAEGALFAARLASYAAMSACVTLRCTEAYVAPRIFFGACCGCTFTTSRLSPSKSLSDSLTSVGGGSSSFRDTLICNPTHVNAERRRQDEKRPRDTRKRDRAEEEGRGGRCCHGEGSDKEIWETGKEETYPVVEVDVDDLHVDNFTDLDIILHTGGLRQFVLHKREEGESRSREDTQQRSTDSPQCVRSVGSPCCLPRSTTKREGTERSQHIQQG